MLHASDPDPRSLAAAWLGAAATATARLPSSGFSGAAIHEVRTATERYVLKAFAAGGTAARAAWIHGLACHLRAEGIGQAPDVLATPAGHTLVVDDGGRVWELVRFVPGTATPDPSPGQAAAALESLARLHLAAAGLPGRPCSTGPSAGFAHRIERARRLRAEPWRSRLRGGGHANARALPAAMRDRLASAAAAFAAADGGSSLDRVSALAPPPLPLQPVLRDVWAEHVLFAAEAVPRVAGFIDLHAAGVDTPAGDVARLLGSWSPPDSAGGWLGSWAAAIAAYETQRPLTRLERWAIPVLHATGVVFGLDNWFRWVLEEGRTFPDPAAVLGRTDALLARLAPALQELATIAPVSETGPI